MIYQIQEIDNKKALREFEAEYIHVNDSNGFVTASNKDWQVRLCFYLGQNQIVVPIEPNNDPTQAISEA